MDEKEGCVSSVNDIFLSTDDLERELVQELGELQRNRKKSKERIGTITKAIAKGLSKNQEAEFLIEATEINEMLANMISDLYILVSRATRGNYSPEDVARWMSSSRERGASCVPITPRLIRDLVRLNIVPNEPFRRKYAEVRDLIQPRELAWRVGSSLRRIEVGHEAKYGSAALLRKEKGKEIGDHTGIKRLLGEEPYAVKSDGTRYIRVFINYFQAVALSDVLGIQYQHVGI